MVTTKLKTVRPAFTLIELLIVIAIIAILIGILIPSLDRSLGRNRLANDVEVFRAKLEEVRILAGSTRVEDEVQGVEEVGTDRAGYYGIYLPNSTEFSNQPFFALVRLSYPFTKQGTGYCSVDQVVTQAKNGEGPCVVDRVNFTRGISYETSAMSRIVAYRTPAASVVELYCSGNNCSSSSQNWKENGEPKFNKGINSGAYLTLTYRNKLAKINLREYTAKVIVDYSDR